MAILVALSFFFLLVSETMPASSTNSIIGEFYSVTMVEITLSLFLNVLVLRFHHMTEEKVPQWVKVRVKTSTFAISYQYKFMSKLAKDMYSVQPSSLYRPCRLNRFAMFFCYRELIALSKTHARYYDLTIFRRRRCAYICTVVQITRLQSRARGS